MSRPGLRFASSGPRSLSRVTLPHRFHSKSSENSKRIDYRDSISGPSREDEVHKVGSSAFKTDHNARFIQPPEETCIERRRLRLETDECARAGVVFRRQKTTV